MGVPCGCGGGQVTVSGIAPIYVNRSGVRPVDYQVGIGPPGADPCQAITDCVHLGPGLVRDEGTGAIQAFLSRDAGNTLHFGTDGGLKNLEGGEPSPDECRVTVDSLPEADLIGAKALAGLHNPYSSPYGLEYCLANRIDLIHYIVGTTADGVGVVSDYWAMEMVTRRSSIYVDTPIALLNSATVKTAYNYAGNVDDPVSHTPTSRSDRGGGWYGWLAQRYHQPLAEDFLRTINGRAIAVMACVPSGATVGSEAHHVQGAIRAAMQTCTQDSVMIAVAEIPNATTVLNAGITPIMMPDGQNPPATWGVDTLPYPPADLTAAGIGWIILSDHYTDAVISAYVDAGLSVILMGNSRHEQRPREQALGVRGVMGLDPVYYRAGRGAPSYVGEYDPIGLRRPGVGQLTHRTDQHGVIDNAGLVRGRPKAEGQGLILPPGFGGGLGRPSVLCGWESDGTPAPASYRITYDCRWNTLAPDSAGRAKMSLLFGALTDESTLAYPQDNPDLNPAGYPDGQVTMYRAFQRQSGEIGIAKWGAPGETITYLATLDTPPIAAGFWSTYTIEVSGDQIVFSRELTDGTTYSVTAADDQYRGPYMYIEKEETFVGASGDEPNEFEGEFRNVDRVAL
ncbi:hypothetical protein [Streptomyces sp. NBRC 109706]|uniref:hypothetical protein n=1 Tax=Streptomyces sp. NBRC 109706 TaxID=1550035 RepID=UPI0007823BF2|nr:hypothetical protein [Streptomyces sp. NBRC 109706]